MYPGRQHATYSSSNSSSNSRYSRPQGAPPPPQYQQQQYQRPASQPSNYQRPSAPPPSYGNNQQYQQYQRPQGAPPPTKPQEIGHTGVQYQYSNCTGKRKALIIGINYIGTKNALRGCINDAHAMFNFLTDRYGYKAEDIVMLTDDQTQMVRVPTRQNILRAMQWLVSETRQGDNDSLVFHYSGHGGLEKNLTGDEESGYDSCIYPVDFQTSGSIIDDVMHDIMIRPLPAGNRLTAFFDSCHSGTALDLPYIYSTKGVVKEPNVWKDVGTNGLNAVMSYAQGNIGGVMTSLSGAFKKATQGDSYRQQQIVKNFSPADVIMLSGSKDEQTSADTTEFGMATGAMSYSFINVMASQPNQTYLSLLNNMRSAMSGKYSQKPQLSSSHPIDVNLQFIM